MIRYKCVPNDDASASLLALILTHRNGVLYSEQLTGNFCLLNKSTRVNLKEFLNMSSFHLKCLVLFVQHVVPDSPLLFPGSCSRYSVFSEFLLLCFRYVPDFVALFLAVPVHVTDFVPKCVQRFAPNDISVSPVLFPHLCRNCVTDTGTGMFLYLHPQIFGTCSHFFRD